MKKLLFTLSIVFMALGLCMMLTAAFLVFRTVQGAVLSGDSIMPLVICLFISIFSFILFYCGYCYLKRKDSKSAYNISFLSGVVSWFILNAVFANKAGQLPDLESTVRLVVAVAAGVFVHKIFLRYIRLHFYMDSQLDGAS